MRQQFATLLKSIPRPPLIYVVGLAILAFYLYDKYQPLLSPGEREARAERIYSRNERRDLAQEVIDDKKTFEQAGCEYKGRDWEFDTNVCAP